MARQFLHVVTMTIIYHGDGIKIKTTPNSI